MAEVHLQAVDAILSNLRTEPIDSFHCHNAQNISNIM